MSTRVLHVFKSYFPDTFGGIEKVIETLCLNNNTDISNTLVTLTPNNARIGQDLVKPDFKIIRYRQLANIASTPLCGYSLFADFKQICNDSDVIHYHFPWPMADLLEVFSSTQKPKILTYHSDVINQKLLNIPYQLLKNRFLSKMDKIVVTSPNYYETSHLTPDQKRKTSVIPIGAADESSFSTTHLDDTHAQYRALLSKPYLLYLGGLRYYKGLNCLLKAAQGFECNIIIAGDGNEYRLLKNYKDTHNLSNVHFIRNVDDDLKWRLLKNCLAFVFPSNQRSEAFGIVLLEAAMFGKALITTELGTGTSYVNKHNETGIVVAPDNASQLHQAMHKIYTCTDTRKQFGENSRARYLSLFTAKKMVDQYTRLYESMGNTTI